MSTAIEANLKDPAMPLYLLANDQLQEKWVSKYSQWKDRVWMFEATTAGQPRSDGKVVWHIDLPDGSRLTDPQWANLLDVCKRFLYSLMEDPPGLSRHLKVGSLKSLRNGLGYFIQWMVMMGYRSFAEVDAVGCDEYLEYLAERKVKSDDNAALTVNHLSYYTKIPILIYAQAEKLARAGVLSIPELPFQGKSAMEVARQLSNKVASLIPPVPDEIFLPITTKVIEWLGIPARDIIELQRVTLKAREKNLYAKKSRNLSQFIQREAIESFRFSPLPGSASPWRPSIEGRGSDNLKESLPAAGQVGLLVTDLKHACVIAIQAFTGMRISEVCSLQAEPIDENTGLPACIKIKPSESGLYDVFYIIGKLFKTAAVSEEVTWVAGLRPYGTDTLPLPIQAILILEELFRPWRRGSGKSELILSFGKGWWGGLPRQFDNIVPALRQELTRRQKDWVSRYVELPYSWHLTTHQWRKSFALYTLRTDSRMLTAISQHFKHVSLAMTSEHYIGRDLELLGLMDDIAVRETSRILYDLTTGKVPVSGKMGDLLRERLPHIKSRFEGISDKEKRAEIEALVSGSAELRVYSCDWGWCFFRSETSLCNPGDQRPSPIYRCPQTCCDCSNLAVTPEHRPYWSQRLEENQHLVEECRAKGLEHEAFVAKARIVQCQSVLRMMERLEI
jgi:integrase